MKKPDTFFTDNRSLLDLIKTYFEYIEGEYHLENKPAQKPLHPNDVTEQKVWHREPEPATITGLAFFLGFSSLDEFEDYEKNGKYALPVKRARLRIETIYEKKLHYQSPTGAVFALKRMGWNDKPEAVNVPVKVKNIKVKIIKSGPPPASSEKDVVL